MSQLPSAAGTAGAVRFNPMSFSRAAAARHPLESRWSIFADVYQTLLGAVVLLSYAGALLYGIREELLVNAGSVLTRSVISDRFAQVPAQTAIAAVLLLETASLSGPPDEKEAARGCGGCFLAALPPLIGALREGWATLSIGRVPHMASGPIPVPEIPVFPIAIWPAGGFILLALLIAGWRVLEARRGAAP